MELKKDAALSVPKGYKHTGVGIIPEDWDIYKLGNIVEFLDGKRKPIKSSDRIKITGKYPYYGASGIIDYVDDFIFDDELILLGEDGENILSRNLPLAFRVKGKIWVNNHAHVLKPKNEVDIDFLTNYLESLDYTLLNSGTAQPKLNKHNCQNIAITLPTLSEQKAIAEVLGDIDTLINTLKTLIAKKKALKQGAMQELLTGKKRLPGFTGEWEMKKLGKMVDFKNGKAHENSVTTNGAYVLVNSKFISTEGKVIKFSKDCFCPVFKGEILMVMSDVPNGKAIAKCFFVDKNEYYTLNQRICTLKVKKDNSKFIFYSINRNPYYLTFDDGVKQTNLRKEDVLGCVINIPNDINEQKAIAQILSDMDTEIEALKTQLQKIRLLKQGMMQALLTGKTRLPCLTPEDEHNLPIAAEPEATYGE